MSIGNGETQEPTEEDDKIKAEEADTRAFIKQLNDCATLQNCISLARSANDPKRWMWIMLCSISNFSTYL